MFEQPMFTQPPIIHHAFSIDSSPDIATSEAWHIYSNGTVGPEARRSFEELDFGSEGERRCGARKDMKHVRI